MTKAIGEGIMEVNVFYILVTISAAAFYRNDYLPPQIGLNGPLVAGIPDVKIEREFFLI